MLVSEPETVGRQPASRGLLFENCGTVFGNSFRCNGGPKAADTMTGRLLLSPLCGDVRAQLGLLPGHALDLHIRTMHGIVHSLGSNARFLADDDLFNHACGFCDDRFFRGFAHFNEAFLQVFRNLGAAFCVLRASGSEHTIAPLAE